MSDNRPNRHLFGLPLGQAIGEVDAFLARL